ncbi:acyltransferase 3 [Caballeronia temeraria]|uniref:Acyltransferase 3 n=1 Tax=Caballeronia temeraria TaxID=1777137 RepID=A0A158C2F7_9BURK|nr:acyltransferase [Caballeronia temeraria]SAK76493.1 acyltransferase 3 [Caballeronia temeraria]
MPLWSDSRSLREAISGHDNNYTLIRAILAASVIYFHAFALTRTPGAIDPLNAMLAPVSDIGDLAVQSFFFLSGLFVAQSYSNDPKTIRFILRRFFRIWPGLFVCLFVTAFLSCAISTPKEFARFAFFNGVYEYILRNAVLDLTWYIPGVFEDHALSAINGPIHTLVMEAKMYALLAVLGAVGLLATTRRLGITCVLAGVACLMVGSTLPDIGWFFSAPYAHPAAAMFFAGSTAFALSRWIYPRLWQGILLGIATAILPGGAHKFMFFATVAWALLYLGQSPMLAKLGRPRQDLSYGIYIYGWPCQQFVVAATSTHVNPYLMAALALPLSCVFAAASWNLIEKPAIRLGHLLPAVTINSIKRRASVITDVQRRALRLGGVLFVMLAACISMRIATTAHDFVVPSPLTVRIVDFGPKESKKGTPFNEQPDGTFAIWLKLDGVPPTGTTVYLAGHKLDTFITAGVATANISPSIIATAGEKSVYLERRTVHGIERSKSVHLLISE